MTELSNRDLDRSFSQKELNKTSKKVLTKPAFLRNVKILVFLGIGAVVISYIASNLAYAESIEKLSIRSISPDLIVSTITGDNKWTIYLEGPIDENAADRFLSEISLRGIKNGLVFINSPGGNLLSAMKLGSLIKKYGYSTFVGKEGLNKWSPLPGQCYSACVLAFIGGQFRYRVPESKIGVHRFSRTTTTNDDMDIAQVMSATIASYLQEMSVDVGLFDRMSKAGKNELYLLNDNELKDLRVINDGRLPAKWTIEVVDGMIYLKGEQKTWHGIGKVLFNCAGKDQVLFTALYYAGSNAEKIVETTGRYSIRFGDGFVPLGKPIYPLSIENGFVRATFVLSPDHIGKVLTANSVGWAAHPQNPELFYGFIIDSNGSKKKIKGFIKSCQIRQK